MYRLPVACILVLACHAPALAQGYCIPDDKTVPPLAMVSHRVDVQIEDQAATTKVEQTFRNHTARPLEATYLFPVPKGAGVKEFAMWVDGKKVKAELVEAKKAQQIYTDIVRRMQDPGLLEYVGADLLQLKVFPIPAKGDQKLEFTYTAICKKEREVVEFAYPVRTDQKAMSTLEDFTMRLSLKSQHPIMNIYSPTHAISVTRKSNREAVIGFEKNQARLDKDFQLYHTLGGKEVGLTAMFHRPSAGEPGTFMFLISPPSETPREIAVPRDIVFVLDTSGSMGEDGKLDQAKKALQHCLGGLAEKDRFGLITFATTVTQYSAELSPADLEHLAKAKKWVGKLESAGGTVINDALQAALEMQTEDESRTFTIVFFTDGKPTLGETNIEKILAGVAKKNSRQTRIFTFGVGYNLNAALLDQLAEQTRGASTFVRTGEDLEAKVTGFFDKISGPVLSNLKLSAGKGVTLSEVFPPKLSDLFHGEQLIVLGRYEGNGDVALKLSGTVGKEAREFVLETTFPAQSDDKPFIEDIWARRKVGYLLEQIRLNGEKDELVKEVTRLAKKHGIATPYTSYLIVPDAPIPIVPPRPPRPIPRPWPRPEPMILKGSNGVPRKVLDVANELQQKKGDLERNRGKFEDEQFAKLPTEAKGDGAVAALIGAKEVKAAYEKAHQVLKNGTQGKLHTDKLGVDFSVQMNNLKNQNQMAHSAQRIVNGRTCLEVGGIWIDEEFTANSPTITVKAMSDAYFRILERQPRMSSVFQLGGHLIWLTPNRTALVIDLAEGKEQLTDAEIDKLFAAPKVRMLRELEQATKVHDNGTEDR